MVGRALLACLVCSLSVGVAWAQLDDERRGPGRSRDEPTQPEPGITGQVMADTPQFLIHPIEVRLEASGAHVLSRAYTDGAGNFEFDNIQSAGTLYIAIDVDGFEPVRQRVERIVFSSAARGFPTIVVLERSDIDDEGESIDPRPVDLRQLSGEIPEKAFEEFEKAANDSRKGDHEKAAERLEEVVELAQHYHEAQNALGVAYTRLGQYREAESSLEMARAEKPSWEQPLINLGFLYLQEHDLQSQAGQAEQARLTLRKAVVSLESAIEVNEASAAAQYYFGAALYKTGRYRRAVEALNRSLELDAEFHEARLMLVNVRLAQGDSAGALEQVILYLERNPESPQREAVEKMMAELKQLVEP